jgi:hypothetical protein
VLDSVDLELYVGPVVPVPVSKEVLDALVSVRVTTATRGPDVFQLEFDLSTRSPLHTLFLLANGAASMLPIMRVVIAVRLGGQREVLIDGVVTNNEIGPGPNPGTATLSVIGENHFRTLDMIDFSGIPYPAMPDFARVTLILAKYAFLGIIPKVIPSVLLDVPVPIDRIPTHQGKDLGYIQMLADRVGYVFYMEPGPEVGTTFAYWGPEIKVGQPQSALSLDFDGNRTVDDVRFTFDASKAVLPIVYIHNPQTKAPIPIPVPDITPLSPPLGAIPAIPLRIEPIETATKFSPVQAVLIGMAKAAQSSGKTVTATGRLDVQRYGKVLKPRRLVGVRGVGPAFDGLYYVDGVTSIISRGDFKQEFRLSRNGLLSTVDKVAA